MIGKARTQWLRRECLGAVPLLLGAALPAAAASFPANPCDMIRLLAPGQAPAPATLGDIAWLEGQWFGQMPNAVVDNVVMPARGGQMPSFVRALDGARNDHIVFYEMTVFVEVGTSITQRVKHFTPELSGWEAQSAYIDRPLVAKDNTSLYFDGSTFTRTGPDSYTVYHLNRNNGEEAGTIVVPFRRR